MTCSAVVTAGGIGERMGSDKPKQYLPVGGIPIIVRTLQVFQKQKEIDFIVLTTPKNHEDYCLTEFVKPYGITKVRAIVPGGNTRQESVMQGLLSARDSHIVVIHDSVRPLVKPDIIMESIQKAQVYGSAIAACPVSDTVKIGSDFISDTFPRDNLWLAHTPQTFRTQLILEAHEKALREGFQGTDDSSLVENMGLSIAIVRDSSYNLKITLPEDILIAEKLLAINID